jgi:uncharacterized protein
MTRSLVLSGGGPYSDPWHQFEATSACLAQILQALDHDVEISQDVADRLTDLTDVDVVVVNAAAGPESSSDPAARAGLLEYLERGGAVLAVHVSACTLLRVPEWEAVTGAAWITGRSGHAQLGHCRATTHPDRHPIVETIRDFELVDECYRSLRMAPDVVPLVSHTFGRRSYPLVWTRERGPARVVVDTLGHGVESYESAEHRQLLARSVQWLTGHVI